MNNVSKVKVIDACFPIISILSITPNDEAQMKKLYGVLSDIVDEVVSACDIENENVPPQDGRVWIYMPMDELKEAKNMALTALAPKVTFDEDFEVMKQEADTYKGANLQALCDWFNRKLK